MATTHTILNQRDVNVASDRVTLPGDGSIQPYIVTGRAEFTINDNQIGPTMEAQIANGIFEIISSSASQPSLPSGSEQSQSLLGVSADLDVLDGGLPNAIVVDLAAALLTGYQLVPTFLLLDINAFSGFSGVTADPTFTIGSNGPTYDNVMGVYTAVGVASADEKFSIRIGGLLPALTNTGELRIKLASAATVSGATTPIWTARARVYGYVRQDY